MTNLLFAYGTLNPEFAPPEISEIVGRFVFVGTATIRGRVYDLGPYRGAVIDETTDETVRGNVYRVPDFDSVAMALDLYEGCDPADGSRSLFVRRRATADLGGERLEVWMNVYNGELPGIDG